MFPLQNKMYICDALTKQRLRWEPSSCAYIPRRGRNDVAETCLSGIKVYHHYIIYFIMYDIQIYYPGSPTYKYIQRWHVCFNLVPSIESPLRMTTLTTPTTSLRAKCLGISLMAHQEDAKQRAFCLRLAKLRTVLDCFGSFVRRQWFTETADEKLWKPWDK